MWSVHYENNNNNNSSTNSINNNERIKQLIMMHGTNKISPDFSVILDEFWWLINAMLQEGIEYSFEWY